MTGIPTTGQADRWVGSNVTFILLRPSKLYNLLTLLGLAQVKVKFGKGLDKF